MADDNRGGREQRPRRAGSKPPSRSRVAGIRPAQIRWSQPFETQSSGGSRSDGARPSGKPRGQGHPSAHPVSPGASPAGNRIGTQTTGHAAGKPRRDGDERGRGQSGGNRIGTQTTGHGKPRDGDERGPSRRETVSGLRRQASTRRDGDERGRGQSGGKPAANPGDSRPRAPKRHTRGGGRPDRAGREQSSYRGRDDRARSDRSPRGFDDRPGGTLQRSRVAGGDLRPRTRARGPQGSRSIRRAHWTSPNTCSACRCWRNPIRRGLSACRASSRSGFPIRTGAPHGVYRRVPDRALQGGDQEESAYRRINGKFDLRSHRRGQ